MRRLPTWRLVLRVVLLAAMAVLVAVVVAGNTDELDGASAYLAGVRPGWVALAIAAEAGSYLAFAALQGRLLRAGGVRVGMGPLSAIALAGGAMATSLPGGGAFSAVFAYRQYRRRGADETLAAWVLIAEGALTAVTLGALATAGLAVAGSGGRVPGLVPFIVVLVVVPAVGMGVLLRPHLAATLLSGALHVARRVVGRPGDPDALVRRTILRLVDVEPRGADWVIATVWALANWATDCGCLVVAFLAVGAPVPTRALLMAYGAAQVVANMPITPGGLGVVEGSLTVALVAFGGRTDATVAAVLLYRLLSFWAVLPLGWGSWLVLRVRAARAAHEEVAVEPSLAIAGDGAGLLLTGPELDPEDST